MTKDGNIFEGCFSSHNFKDIMIPKVRSEGGKLLKGFSQSVYEMPTGI